MLYDCHIHTEFSADSELKIKDILEKAKKNNLGIITTEHLDYNLKTHPQFAELDIEGYLKEYSKYRGENMQQGVELGLAMNNVDENFAFYEKYKDKFDMIIGSIHSINGVTLSRFLKQDTRPKEVVYGEYLDNMLKCIEFYDIFDTLGHIDYPCRYSTYDDKEMTLTDFKPKFQAIFKTLIAKNKVLELNTTRLDDETSFKNMVEIYSYYRELGGKYITLGSDSHKIEHVGRNFEKLYKFLEETKLTPCYFKDRKLIPCSYPL